MLIRHSLKVKVSIIFFEKHLFFFLMKLPILLFLSKVTSNKRSVFFCLKYINNCNIAECLWMNFSKNELSHCYLCDPLSFCWVFQNDIIHKITPHDFEHCSQSPINPQLDPDSALHSMQLGEARGTILHPRSAQPSSSFSDAPKLDRGWTAAQQYTVVAQLREFRAIRWGPLRD